MKKLNYLIFALIFMVGMSFEVKAAAADDILCITSAGKHQCVLSENLVVSEQLVVQGDIELDLNGYTISVDSNADLIRSGVIGVLRDAKLTINDTVGTGKIASGTKAYAAVALTISGESAEGRDATLVVNGGTLEGLYYAVVGNGSRHGTSITINGGTLNGVNGTGIYHPQVGTLVINNGATITGGETGIEMRSGSLIVNGGTITGNGTSFSVEKNGSGTTTIGAGIAIVQHTTNYDINVQIKDGTISGVYAVYEDDIENEVGADKIKLSINGGTFNAINDGTAAIYSENVEDFVVSGTFNKAVDAAYLAPVAKVEESNGVYVIASDNSKPLTGDTNAALNFDEITTTYESTVYTAPVETYDVDLSWDDLHWVFVYEGPIDNPTNSVWLSKEAYDAIKTDSNNANLSSNEINGAILGMDNLNPDLNINVINHSVFAVDVLGSIDGTKAALDTDYSSSALLKMKLEGAEEYTPEANISALATNANANILIRPTANRFVNNAGVSVTVTGEVNLTFTKTN